MNAQNAELVMKIASDAPVYIFTLQARNDGENVAPTLTLTQLEAARNAAVSVLELVGATVESTSAVLNVAAPPEDSRLVLTPTVKTLAEIARETAETQAQTETETETGTGTQTDEGAKTLAVEEIGEEPSENVAG